MKITSIFAFLFTSIILRLETVTSQKAVAVLVPESGGATAGTIFFTANGKTVTVNGSVTGLNPGLHGFHIHEFGDLSNGCISTGGHFNPFHKDHGAPSDIDRHVGDLGNIMASSRGTATVAINDTLITLSGKNSIIGRAVVVHAGVDDLGKGGYSDSLTTGHAGARVACGIIGLVNNVSKLSASKLITILLTLVLYNFTKLQI